MPVNVMMETLKNQEKFSNFQEEQKAEIFQHISFQPEISFSQIKFNVITKQLFMVNLF